MSWPFQLTGTDVPILVPRRADNGKRDFLWNFIRSTAYKDANVVEGFHEGPGPFNRSAAINDAAEKAGDWRVAVIADADSFVAPWVLKSAISMCQDTLTIPHSRWVNVEEDEKNFLVHEGWLPYREDRIRYNLTYSSVLVVPRSVWDTVNGFDERFVGWGWEDTAFMQAVNTLAGGHIRLEGDVYHLAHDRPHADINRSLDPGYLANANHFGNMYKRSSDPTQLRRVIAKNRATL